MTAAQHEILRALQRALAAATEFGVLDLLATYVNPDVINEFCDAVDELEKN